MAECIRILLLADTHLGFDLPSRPRVQRRRRGHDFLANYERALEPARMGEVDVVVHGGDVFHRSRVASDLARRALRPLLEVADLGVPVFVVPGNHERARLPSVFHRYAGIRVFDVPRTFVIAVRGVRVALAGFPYERRSIRTRFGEVLRRTGWSGTGSDVALLCMHHCVEGATVGPGDFTFTTASDVIRGRDLPEGFAAVLSGHIHRRQVLTADLRGRRLPAPVLYPGSVERTSTAEIDEPKGYFVLDVNAATRAVTWSFAPLPARPMMVRTLRLDGLDARAADAALRRMVAAAPADAVLRIRVSGDGPADVRRALSAARVRAIAPRTMNVELSDPERFRNPPTAASRLRAPLRPQLDLDLTGAA